MNEIELKLFPAACVGVGRIACTDCILKIMELGKKSADARQGSIFAEYAGGCLGSVLSYHSNSFLPT
ncbi:hypothetical protein E2C01_098707 [Portunus trituberculatus]|uniref:Uncharacterized protein n=1 Tax=Portunus trituberculatus TaxID=210409 RepID=A0A5B7KCS6_PORTR|nr:hypothetical protein [Portunus trituberculatus]